VTISLRDSTRLRHVARLLTALVAASVYAQAGYARDVPYVPTPERVVKKMLELAEVGAQDVVYDLGSGDGRIVITAAKEYGARGVGVDIDPERVREAKENAAAAGVTDRVEFREGDLFETDLRDATVVTLYLVQSVNERLRPKLLCELKAGSRVVSHGSDMGDWKPRKQLEIDGDWVYYWLIPEAGAVCGSASAESSKTRSAMGE
jgi:SAM-dependent methyltransferase